MKNFSGTGRDPPPPEALPEGSGLYTETIYRQAYCHPSEPHWTEPEPAPESTLSIGSDCRKRPDTTYAANFLQWEPQDAAMFRGKPDPAHDSLRIGKPRVRWTSGGDADDARDGGSKQAQKDSPPLQHPAHCILAAGPDAIGLPSENCLVGCRDLFQLGPPSKSKQASATGDYLGGATGEYFRGVSNHSLDYPPHQPSPRKKHGSNDRPLFGHLPRMTSSTTHRDHYAHPPAGFRPPPCFRAAPDSISTEMASESASNRPRMRDATQTMLDFREAWPIEGLRSRWVGPKREFTPPTCSMETETEAAVAFKSRTPLPPKQGPANPRNNFSPVTPLSGEMKDKTIYKLDFGREKP